MQPSLAPLPETKSFEGDFLRQRLPRSRTSYSEAEHLFLELLITPNLDEKIRAAPTTPREFERTLEFALYSAYEESPSSALAHRFLQRVLYKINRLKLFWYDDLRSYDNERSSYLQKIRNRIEERWERWELAHLGVAALRHVSVEQALRDRTAADLNPPPSLDSRYFRDELTLEGYRKLLEIASLDGLVEASQLSRTLAGVGNEIHAMLTRLLVEEYGGGRLTRKHSFYFTSMLESLGMNTEPEAYFDQVPWEVLAGINHSFLLSERKRYFLRYIGGLLYTETSVPAAFFNYKIAAERLGLPSEAHGYWDIHIKEDERHGRWMLHDVSLPLAEKYRGDAWELVLGYDQQRFISSRAGSAVADAARKADTPSQLRWRSAATGK